MIIIINIALDVMSYTISKMFIVKNVLLVAEVALIVQCAIFVNKDSCY
jgi:hypothetical protein